MALKKLTVGEMLSITNAWVDKHHAEHAALAAIPEVKGLLPRVAQAHEKLLTVAAPTQPSGESDEISRTLKTTDERHDNLARGVYYVLLGCAFLAKKPKVGASYLALQELLLPDGIKLIQQSYREESGHGAMLAKALKPEHKDLLGEVPTPFGTVRDAVDEWLSVARKLGELEDKRTAASEPAFTGTDLVQARNQWIRAVNAVVSMLELVDDENPTVTRVLARVREAERKADRRSASAGASGATDGEGDPGKPAT